jgi:hypothetical protein
MPAAAVSRQQGCRHGMERSGGVVVWCARNVESGGERRKHFGVLLPHEPVEGLLLRHPAGLHRAARLLHAHHHHHATPRDPVSRARCWVGDASPPLPFPSLPQDVRPGTVAQHTGRSGGRWAGREVGTSTRRCCLSFSWLMRFRWV